MFPATDDDSLNRVGQKPLPRSNYSGGRFGKDLASNPIRVNRFPTVTEDR